MMVGISEGLWMVVPYYTARQLYRLYTLPSRAVIRRVEKIESINIS